MIAANGPLPRILRPVTVPASWCYAAVVGWRNRRFDAAGVSARWPLPTISVGNITVGGTGKTPMVAWIVEALTRNGRRPLIAMRGYKAQPGEAGDEEREYRLIAPGTPVVAHPRRFDAVSRYLAEHPGSVDVVVLDDGFQHRQVARDFDLVLVDAQRPALEGPLLPAGWLREPPASLRRASAVVVTRAEGVDDALARQIVAWHGHWPVAWSRHAWRGLDLHGLGAVRREPTAWLAGKRVFGVFGTGNPEAVRRAYHVAGATVVESAAVADHAEHPPGAVEAYRKQAERFGCAAIATTRKDWTKIGEREIATGLPFVVPDVGIEFLAGEDELLRRLVGVAAARR